MLVENLFARGDVAPSWFANAIQRALSVIAAGFQIVTTDATHIKVAAGPGDQAAVVAINGQWRWMEADVGPVAHPGGAAGLYPVFVTSKNSLITSTPLPYTDATDRTFALQIKAPGGTPTIVPGAVDQYRHVADLVWDGASITAVQQIVPVSAPHGYRHVVGGADPIVGAWLALTPGAGYTAASGSYDTASGRLTGASVQLRGAVVTPSGGTFPGQTVVSLPAALQTTKTRGAVLTSLTGAVYAATVLGANVAIYATAPASIALSLESITYPL